MERYKEIINRILELCAAREEIRAIIVIGSQARKNKKADEYSDLDLIVVCDVPEKLLYKDEWLNHLGKREYSFVEDTIANQKERRVLFEGSLDVDFIVLSTEFFRFALENHLQDDIMKRGYRILYDDAGFSDSMAKIPVMDHMKNDVPSEEEFRNLVNEFYYHIVWTEKKISRGELWTAKMCVDVHLKNLLLRMIEMYEICVHGIDFDVWHNGRMLEEWADEDIVQELSQCFAHYDADDIKKALDHTAALFTRLSKVCAEKYDYVSGVKMIDNK